MQQTQKIHYFVSVGNSIARQAQERVIQSTGQLITSDLNYSAHAQKATKDHKDSKKAK